jgi:hypothetical protein
MRNVELFQKLNVFWKTGFRIWMNFERLISEAECILKDWFQKLNVLWKTEEVVTAIQCTYLPTLASNHASHSREVFLAKIMYVSDYIRHVNRRL